MKWEYEEFEVVSKSGNLLHMRHNWKGEATPQRVVLFASGDGAKGSHSLSWSNIPPMLAERGIGSFLFDFSGLGKSKGVRQELTVEKAIFDLTAALGELQSQCPNSRVGFMGASFGAAVALLVPELFKAIDCCTLKSPAPFLAEAYVNEVGIDTFQSWANGDATSAPYDFEMVKSALRFNCFKFATDYSSPCLITHGTEDEIVPFSHSVLLAATMSNATLKSYHGGNHSYSLNNDWQDMAETQVAFLDEHL